MNDVRFSDVQQAAARWTQGVEARGAGEAQSIQGARLDFDENNVTFTPHRDGVVTPRDAKPEIPGATVLLDQTKAAQLQKTVNSLHNDLLTARLSDAEREQNVSMLLELSQMAAADEPKAERPFFDAYKITSFIAEVTNKQQSTMAKVGAEMARGQEKLLEKQKEAIASEGPNIGTALASSILSLGSSISGTAAGAEFFGKKGMAVFKMLSATTGQGANIVQLFDQENEKEKSAKTVESKKNLAIIKASMQGTMQLEKTAGELVGQITEAVKEINESSMKNQIHV